MRRHWELQPETVVRGDVGWLEENINSLIQQECQNSQRNTWWVDWNTCLELRRNIWLEGQAQKTPVTKTVKSSISSDSPERLWGEALRKWSESGGNQQRVRDWA